jgi:hypothetical protein
VVLDVQVDWEKMECRGSEDGVTVTVTVVVVRQRAATRSFGGLCVQALSGTTFCLFHHRVLSVSQPASQSLSQSVSLVIKDTT